MGDIVNKMLNLMEPYVFNIEEINKVLKQKEAYLNELTILNNEINDEALNLIYVDNLEFLLQIITEQGSNSDEYQAYKYVLNSNIKEVMALPQYNEALTYFENLYKYIKNRFTQMTDEYGRLLSDYERNMVINKYYLMMKENNVFILDSDEFINMLDVLELSINDKNLLLTYVLKENKKTYYLNIKDDDNLEFDLEKVNIIINENKELLSKEYNELLNVVSEYVDLSKNISDIIDDELINKINIRNILLAKKVWLLKKISFSYRNQHCRKCKIIASELDHITNLLDKVGNIKNQREIIKIIKGEI